MERRDFVGAMLAVFCGVAMPEPLIEAVRLIQPITLVKVPGEVTWTDDIDKMLKEIYCKPIMDQMVMSQGLYNQMLAAMLEGGKEDEKGRYVETSHYFELPAGWQARDEGLTLG